MMAGRFVVLLCFLAVVLLPVAGTPAQDPLPNSPVRESGNKPVGFLSDQRPGYWLSHTGGLGVWWCESGRKIGCDRGLPEKPGDGRVKPVAASAARGEFEPVQLILRAEEDGELLAVTINPIRNDHGDMAKITARLDEVAYLNVTQPTDKSCQPGCYPDPLPPLRTPRALRAGQNQPLWLTFHVPRAIRRMLTEHPEKSLLGHVEIWCGLTPEWTPEKVRARDKDWTQEGVYVSFNLDLANTRGWSTPRKILGDLRKDQWYPQVIGLDHTQRETDKLADRKARLYVCRQSQWEIVFLVPDEGK